MSSALKTAIYNRLTGVEVLTGWQGTAQTTLAGLLATDPDTGRPAVYAANKNDAPLQYPCVTFRLNAGTIAPEFQDGTGGVDQPIVDVEIWENTRLGNLVSDIQQQLYLLLDDRAGGALLPIANNLMFSLQTFVPLSDSLYDPKLRAWFGLWRLTAVEGR